MTNNQPDSLPTPPAPRRKVAAARSETPPPAITEKADVTATNNLPNPLSDFPTFPLGSVTTVQPDAGTYNVPTVRMVFASTSVTQKVARLALALDNIGANTLPILVSGVDEHLAEVENSQPMQETLNQVSQIPDLKTLTFGGGISSLIGLATGDEQNSPPSNDSAIQLDNAFLTTLAARHYLDPAVVQSLREIKTSNELLRLISSRRLGWLFDEICRLACLEIRKKLSQPTAVEAIAFGTSGAVLGRAIIEPGHFVL